MSTVILCAGQFPRKGGAAHRVLSEAERVVACDGAAREYRRRFKRWPDVIVGDMDSVGVLRGFKGEAVYDPSQDDNDLAKALRLCERRGWQSPVVVGATGKREDHALGNFFRALEAQVWLYADECVFIPVCGTLTIKVEAKRGSGLRSASLKRLPVSVFATDPKTKMTSKGLEWPLDGVKFKNLYCATLNRTTGKVVTITSDRPAYVCLNFLKQNPSPAR